MYNVYVYSNTYNITYCKLTCTGIRVLTLRVRVTRRSIYYGANVPLTPRWRKYGEPNACPLYISHRSPSRIYVLEMPCKSPETNMQGSNTHIGLTGAQNLHKNTYSRKMGAEFFLRQTQNTDWSQDNNTRPHIIKMKLYL